MSLDQMTKLEVSVFSGMGQLILQKPNTVMLRFHLSHHPIGLTLGQASITMSTSLHQRAGCVPTDSARTEVMGKEDKEERAACVHESKSWHLVSGLQVAQLSQSDSNLSDSTSQEFVC